MSKEQTGPTEQTGPGPYDTGLERNPANCVPLSPIGFLERAAAVYPDRISVIHGELRWTWSETFARCRRLASALRSRGIGMGDTVSVMAPNIPALYEAHFAVAMTGAVLNAINTRLDANNLAFILSHGESKVLIADAAFADVIREALGSLAAIAA